MYLIMQLAFLIAGAQDTTFVRSLPLDSAVVNIDSDGDLLYLRFEHNLYSWKNEQLRFVQQGKFKYSWVSFDSKRNQTVINHNNVIGFADTKSAQTIGSLIPGEYNYTTTVTLLGDYLYVCYNGIVLEYVIRPGFTRKHKGNSIRHVYSEPGFRVISTYNGIFIDTIFNVFNEARIGGDQAAYSSGEFVRIDSTYYLCQDNLLVYDWDSRNFTTLINTEGSPRFRRLLNFDNRTFALYGTAFGELNLESEKREYLLEDEFTDFLDFNGKIYITSLNSLLYEVDRLGNVVTIPLSSPGNDLMIYQDELYIGTDHGLFRFKNQELEEVIPEVEIVQALVYEDKFIYTNNHGMYYFIEDEIVPLIENIEFNKMALHQDQHYLYAGSVNGLYVIDNSQLSGLIQHRPLIIEQPQGRLSYVYAAGIILILAGSSFWLFRRRKLKSSLSDVRKKASIDSELIRTVIKAHPEILSVGQLAEFFDTSVVQLNRNLKREGLTALVLLKSIMKEVALEMHSKGSSPDDISKRVGYSVRYIKANFLKG